MSANELTVESLLRAHAPHAPEGLRARVLEGAPVARTRLSLPPRRLALVALPAACGLAVAAALVHGVVRSGDHANSSAQGGSGSAASVTTAESLHSFDSARAAVKQHGSASSAAAGALAIASSRLAHTDASLQIRVGDTDALSAATTRATRIATSLGGYAKSVQYSSPQTGGGAATIDLRVPAQNVKAAIARLSGLGTIVSQQLSVTDLQDRFKTQSAQIAQLHRRVAALLKAIADSSLPEAQRVLLRIQLAEAKRAVAQRTNARRGTLAAGATARIELVIGTEKAIAPVSHRGRLDRMLHSAVDFLALEAMIALYVLIVVSPLALVAALVWLWRRRSVDRLLAA
jgi:hypothetical protein